MGGSLWNTFYNSLFPQVITKLLVTIHHCSQNSRETSFYPEVYKEKSKQLTSPVEKQLRGRQGSDKMDYSKETHREERIILIILHIAKVAAAVAYKWGVTHCSLLLNENIVSQFFKCCLIFSFKGITWSNSWIWGHLCYRAVPLLYTFWALLSRDVHCCATGVLKRISSTISIDILQSIKHWFF